MWSALDQGIVITNPLPMCRLMTPPDTPLSPELGPSTVLLNRTLSAIKTSRVSDFPSVQC